jgi:alkylation response protein AidB-like acyl-CoA dehydrogenase
MALTLTPEQQLLRDNAREFVQQTTPVNHLRRTRDQQVREGFSREVWEQMAEFGWVSSCIPEAYGGMGLGYTELGVVLEECGRTLVPTPFVSSVLLGAGVLLQASQPSDDEHKRALLPGIAAGKLLLALAFEESPRFDPHHVACKAERVGANYRLSGHKSFVLDGHVADKLIVSARTSGGTSERDGISLFLIDPRDRGVKLQPQRLLDSHVATHCSLDAVEVPATALIGAVDRGADLLAPVLDRTAICLSAEMLGLCQQAYDITLEYLKTRVQFDVQIGSFQALQHRAVDMFCALELAKSVVLDALTAIDEQRADVPLMASAVKARLTDVSRHVTREAVQLHGGIGMTDEHDIGFYLKRGATTEAMFGDSAYHRDRFARLSGF